MQEIDIIDTDALVCLADQDMLPYELLEIIVTLANGSITALSPRQRGLVLEIENVLNYIFIRDKLDDFKKQYGEDAGGSDGTDTDD